MLTTKDLYEILGEAVVSNGHADGTPERPEVRDPAVFRDAAERMRRLLVLKGLRVSAEDIPILPHDPDGIPGKYVRIG